MNNNIRFDLSDYLIHFFRDIDLESNKGIRLPEFMGWQNLDEDTYLPAFFMLRAALRNGRLWATWSFRNGVRTIYGPEPAICFTEMPIAAFLQAGNTRWANGEAMSSLALVFPKNELFLLGARPVIYGSSSNDIKPFDDFQGNRMLSEKTFPSHEQYRYVTFKSYVDWTHEREWRLPYRGNVSDLEAKIKNFGTLPNWYDIPGLDFLRNINGLGVIVKTKEQADLVISDMLTLVDNKQAGIDTFSFVLVSDYLPISTELQNPEIMKSILANAMLKLDPFFSLSKQDCQNYSNAFSRIVEQVEYEADDPIDGECGECWLWLHDNTSLLTRALLQMGRVSVSREGRYLAYLHEFSDSRSLREREEMTSSLAKKVKERFNTPCCYFSVLNSGDPSGVPFYAGDHDWNIGYYNWSSKG